MSDNPTTAERIVNFFDAWHDRYSEHRTDPVFQKAAETYSRLKRTHDFTTSARLAALEAVQEILHGHA
jgi:hypothetical protein